MDKLGNILKIDDKTKVKTFKKGELIQSSQINSTLVYYVKKGILRSYTIDDKGKEHVLIFASEDWLIADSDTDEFKLPNEVYIDCVEDAEVYIFDKEKLSSREYTNEELKQNNKFLERRIAVLQQRVIMLMSVSAKDRYNKFLLSHPTLPNRVPQHMIASYLGITPQALSTIRGEMARHAD